MMIKSPTLQFSLLLCLTLTGCVESNKSIDSSLIGENHPDFVREKVAASSHYKPTGSISDSTPTFIWPKTAGATQYLIGHEDANSSTRWHEYSLTATEANCNQANDTSCSYTPNDIVFDMNDEKAWWVKPYIPGATTQWSKAHVFTYTGSTNPPTTRIKPISPSPEKATSQLNPKFIWTPNNSASRYQIGFESATGDEWASYVFSSSKARCDTDQCSYTLAASQTKFKQGDIKTWWIRSFTNNSWNDWSKGSAFNIDTSRNPTDLLVLTDDDSSDTRLLTSKNNAGFSPKNTLDPRYKMWAQAITVLDNGFYLISHNIKTVNPTTGKKQDTYILFNLLAPNGKSIANKQLNYASHGQDLSVEKISNNQYYVYTRKDNGKGIARFILDTTNIDFNALNNTNAAELNIAHSRDIPINNRGASTPSLNAEKNKFALVSYTSRKVLGVQVINKESNLIKKRFDLDLSNGQPNGSYNQGIAMKDNIIYILRGDWGTQTADNIKKLYVLDANNGQLMTSFSFTLQNTKSYKTIEPEGLVIVDNVLYALLVTRKNSKVSMKLFKLLDI